jgi:hypothetical protein
VDVLTDEAAGGLGLDPWAARDRYVDVASGFAEPEAWAAGELERAGRPADDAARQALLVLMRAQTSRLAMFASCGWFWDDPRRPETEQVLRSAAHAARLMDATCGSRVEASLVADLQALIVPGAEADGRDLYRAALEAVGQPAA